MNTFFVILLIYIALYISYDWFHSLLFALGYAPLVYKIVEDRGSVDEITDEMLGTGAFLLVGYCFVVAITWIYHRKQRLMFYQKQVSLMKQVMWEGFLYKHADAMCMFTSSKNLKFYNSTFSQLVKMHSE